MVSLPFENNLIYALDADRDDELALFRDRFNFPNRKGSDCVYLCGNSLGLMPKNVVNMFQQSIQDWSQYAVDGHFKAHNAWLNFHNFLRDTSAEMVGAKSEEVILMNTLSVNIHLMMASFYRPTGKRTKIIMEAGSFPTDRFAVMSQIQWHGLNPHEHLIELAPRKDEFNLHTEDILQAIQDAGDELALVFFSGIQYYSGQLFDMERITQAGHAVGALVGFDLAHAVGNVQTKLHDWDADFAVWCNYKYMNGGPGIVGGAYVHERFAYRPDIPRLAGWFGNKMETRFLSNVDFDPMKGAEGWMLSEVPILTSAALLASLDIFVEAGFENLCRKRESLTNYLEFLILQLDDPRIQIISPPEARGAQLSLYFHWDGKAVYDKLVSKNVYLDYRDPNVIRIAPTPLYNSYHDAFRFVQILKECLT